MTRKILIAGNWKMNKTAAEGAELAKAIVGMQLVTHQTGPEGRKVKKVLVEDALDIARELYLGITLDRAIGKPVMMVSRQGGMEIEEVAAKDPTAIVKEAFDTAYGLQPYQARKLAFALGLSGETHKKACAFMIALAKAYVATDASLAEINPLLITGAGDVLALDAKMNFDDNALFRHAAIREYRDLDEEDPLEVEASKFGLNYIKLDGNVGCMVNGAGLAMSTMDIIQYAGGRPANFLDVGGGANEEQVKNAMRIILSDANVAFVLFTIGFYALIFEVQNPNFVTGIIGVIAILLAFIFSAVVGLFFGLYPGPLERSIFAFGSMALIW